MCPRDATRGSKNTDLPPTACATSCYGAESLRGNFLRCQENLRLLEVFCTVRFLTLSCRDYHRFMIAVGVRHQLWSRPYPSYELWDRPLNTYKVLCYDRASLTRRVITDSFCRKSVGISCVSFYVCVAAIRYQAWYIYGCGEGSKFIIYVEYGRKVHCAESAKLLTVVNKMRDRHELAIACLIYDTPESTRESCQGKRHKYV
jgi:hypothetical protein